MSLSAKRTERLRLLDAMRGMAALAVVLYHQYYMTPLHSPLQRVLPNAVDQLLQNGRLGVQVFFVLSGYVIAMSIADRRITSGYIARFALRRSIRLDPPYWATLALASALLGIVHRAPTTGRFLAHVVYLQEITGYPEIVPVFWTLTYEIQFYLALVLFVAVAQRLGRAAGWAIAVVPFALSLVMTAMSIPGHGIFIEPWYVFALGVVTYAFVSERVSVWCWLAAALSVMTVAVGMRSIEVAVAVSTAAMIAGAGRAGRLSTWSGGPVLQWLGRVSYSLYLVHFLGNTLAKFLGARATGAFQAAGCLALSVAFSLAAAEIFHLIIERPAHSFSRRVPMSAEPAIANPALAIAVAD